MLTRASASLERNGFALVLRPARLGVAPRLATEGSKREEHKKERVCAPPLGFTEMIQDVLAISFVQTLRGRR